MEVLIRKIFIFLLFSKIEFPSKFINVLIDSLFEIFIFLQRYE